MASLILPLYLRLAWAVRYLGVPKKMLYRWIEQGRLRSSMPKKGAPRLLATREILKLVEEEYGVPVDAVAELPAIQWTEEEFEKVVAQKVKEEIARRPSIAPQAPPHPLDLTRPLAHRGYRLKLREAMQEQIQARGARVELTEARGTSLLLQRNASTSVS